MHTFDIVPQAGVQCLICTHSAQGTPAALESIVHIAIRTYQAMQKWLCYKLLCYTSSTL